MQRLSPSDIETLTSETEEWVEALNDIQREHGESEHVESSFVPREEYDLYL